jgi:hypothetical protein
MTVCQSPLATTMTTSRIYVCHCDKVTMHNNENRRVTQRGCSIIEWQTYAFIIMERIFLLWRHRERINRKTRFHHSNKDVTAQETNENV